MDEERLRRQMTFLAEADKMKSVLRQTLLADGSRRENDAEHSWHFALTGMILFEYAHSAEVDLCRILQMALVHDMVEIYAGDAFCYDPEANRASWSGSAPRPTGCSHCCRKNRARIIAAFGKSLTRWKRRMQNMRPQWTEFSRLSITISQRAIPGSSAAYRARTYISGWTWFASARRRCGRWWSSLSTIQYGRAFYSRNKRRD